MSQAKKVLVIGDVMLDRYIMGEMTRISPEAPAPVIAVKAIQNMIGGAGNVAANIVALGQQVILLGACGPDLDGNDLRWCALAAVGAPGAQLFTSGLTTTVKTRITVGGQQLMRLDYEATLGDCEDAILETIARLLRIDGNIGLVVVADYNKGFVTQRIASDLWARCKARKIPMFVDAKPAAFPNKYDGVTLLKPNRTELDALAAALHPEMRVHDGNIEQVCRFVAGPHPWTQRLAQYLVVTLGAAGAAAYDSLTNSFYTAPATAREVFDVTGAGDTFMAVLATSYMEGITLHRSIRRANLAAGLAVGRHGTAVVTRSELEEAEYAAAGWPGKLMTLGEAQRFIARRQAMQQRVVLTNGCFDCLHPGHIELLKWAKAQGDTLIVAFNNDNSVRTLKGEGRPVVNETYRGMQLAQMACVDCVIMFDDTDVSHTIQQLSPDILVKGAEYIDQAVPGADWVARRGGDVRFAPMFGEFSTTRILDATGGTDVRRSETG